MAKGNSTYNISIKLNSTQFDKAAARLGKQIINIGNTIKFTAARMISNTLQTAFANVISVGKDFENQMARVKAVSNANTQEFKMMEKEARRMGATTKYSASEAADALEYLTRNGLSASKATAILSDVMKFAGANAIGLGESANILTNVLNMFNLSVDKSASVADIMSTAAAKSATNVTELYDAFVNAGPSAASLGLSVEETTAALMTLANVGVKGADAGSKLAQAFSKMLNPKIQEELKAYGININSDTIAAEGLVGALEQFKKAALSKETLVSLFGERSWRGINTLIDNLDKLKANYEETANAAGTTSRMFADGIGSVEKAAKTLKSVFEEQVLAAFDKLKPAIVGILNSLRFLVEAFGNLKAILLVIVGRVLSNFVATSQKITNQNKILAKTTYAEAAAHRAVAASLNQTQTAYAKNLKYLTQVKNKLEQAGGSSAKVNTSIKLLNKALDEFKNKGAVSAATTKALNASLATTAASANTAKNGIVAASGAVTVLKGAIAGIKNVGKSILSFFGGWIGLLITAASVAIPAIVNAIKKHKDALLDLGKIEREAGKEAGEERYQVEALNKIVHDSTLSYNTRATALKKLKDLVPGYNALLSKEGELTNDNVDAISAYTEGLIANAKARLLAAKAAEIDMQIQEKQAKMMSLMDDSGKPTFWDRIVASAASQGGNYISPEDIHKSRIEGKIKKENDAIDKLNQERQKIVDEINKVTADLVKNESISNRETSGVGAGGGDMIDRQKALEEYKKTLENIEKIKSGGGYSSDAEKNNVDAIKEEIDATNKLINSLSGLDDLTEEDIELIKEKRARVIELTSVYDAYNDKVKAAADAEEEEKRARERLNKSFDEAERKWNNRNARDNARTSEWDSVSLDSTEFKAMQVEVEKAQKAYENAAQALNSFTQEQLDMIKNGKASTEDIEKYNKWCSEVEKLKQTYQGLNDEYQKLILKQDIFNKKIDSYTGLYSNVKNIVSSMEGIGSAFDSLKNKMDEGKASIFDYMNTLFSLIDCFISTFESIRSMITIFNDLKLAREAGIILNEKEAASNLLVAGTEEVKGAAAGTAAAEQVAASTTSTTAKTAEATTTVAANTAIAGSGAAAAMSSIPWVGPALAVAAVVTILGTLAALLPKFASGGLVGSKLHGDNNLARVNGNEMILNTAQQRNLMNLINNGGTSGTNASVEFKIRGKDLYASLQNYNNSIKPTISTL